jgi:hypothetical protein
VRGVCGLLETAAIRTDRSRQVALCRFVFAGSTAHPEDRLLDLVMCCEVLIITRPGITGMRNKAPASENAAFWQMTPHSASHAARSRGAWRRPTAIAMGSCMATIPSPCR